MKQVGKKILIGMIGILVLLTGLCVWYVSDYYHVSDADTAMCEEGNVKICKISTGFFYDGPGSDQAIVFYPGAKVEGIAYASLLKELAKEGIDCFLVDMPCHLALLGVSKADDILQSYTYDSYYLMGHSLGGAMAAVYVSEHTEQVDGLILLAAYSTKDIAKTDLSVLSIYGDLDGVLDKEKVKELRANLPKDAQEMVIEGGNHAGFGDYGQQKGDNDAHLTGRRQQEITAGKIVSFMKDSIK